MRLSATVAARLIVATMIVAMEQDRTLRLVAAQADAGSKVTAEPDAITRGKATTVVVTGTNADELKTLRIAPATGLRVGIVKPLEPRPDGTHAVSVTVTAIALAKIGDRDLTVLPAPATPATKRIPVGSIRINSHDVTIANVAVVGAGPDTQLRVTVTDEKYDVVANDPYEVSMDATVLEVPEPLMLVARCGDEDVKASLSSATIEKREGSSVLLGAYLDAESLEGRSGCELRLRVRDSQGNRSGWLTTAFGH